MEKKVLNKSCDVGGLVVEDCESYEGLTQNQVLKKTKDNLCSLYKQLFDLKKQQKEQEGGEDGEILEYTKSAWMVSLPKSTIVLPREKPIPKPKPLTKWEKFR